MFPEIQTAIENKECILEWDNSKGPPPAPLLKVFRYINKDKFSALRKKAKTMNFSIAYGKSSHGFSKDWVINFIIKNCSIEEAEESLKKWYSNRKEVERWQNKVKELAVEKGYTQTMIGRYRNLTKKLADKLTYSHALRASINTPIQGGI